MGLNGYNPQIITISTRCSAQSTRLSYLVHLAQRGERRPITFSNSGCRRTNSPAGRHFGGARGGMNSRDPWNKDGIHKRVFPPSLMTSAYRWGTECSDVLRQRTTEESAVGTERGRTVPSAICANISAMCLPRVYLHLQSQHAIVPLTLLWSSPMVGRSVIHQLSSQRCRI